MVDFCESPISVLGFQQKDGEWASVALELDLWGYCDTKEESAQELLDMVNMQLGFAEYKDNPDLIFRPAPVEYFQIFAEVKARFLRAKAEHETPDEHYFAGGFPFPNNIENSNGFAVING